MPDFIDPILFEVLLIIGIGILFARIFNPVDTTRKARDLKRLEPRNWGAYKNSPPETKEATATTRDNNA